MEHLPFEPYKHPLSLDDPTMEGLSSQVLKTMLSRRSIRDFSDRAVPRQVIENCLLAAGTAPSGANKQPWFFGIIASTEVKKRIRAAAEIEEDLFYNKRATKNWLNDLKAFQTNATKPYLETAPYLIAIFAKMFENQADPKASKNYYPKESVGIATGFLINALHRCGLSTLTHTPSPMDFLNAELGLCKKQYRPFLLLVTGFAATDALVPVIEKKSLDKFTKFY